MAALKEPVKIFIVQSLACFETPQQVADSVEEIYKIKIDRKQCHSYDPTKYAGRNLSKKLKDLFERTRKEFKTNIEDIPIANKAFHFKELQKMYDEWGTNKFMKQTVLKQAQGLLQSGGAVGKSNLSAKEEVELQIKRLELEKLQREVNPPKERPPEEDYKLPLEPDEDIPNEPIL